MELKRYTGTSGKYQDVAVRENTRMGLGVSYTLHPNGTGFLIVRLAAWAPAEAGKIGDFTHLSKRHYTSHMVQNAEGKNTGERVHGRALNKIALPLFTPGVPETQLFQAVQQHPGVLKIIADWITARLTDEGFNVVEDLEAVITAQLALVPIENATLDLNFPTLEKKVEVTVPDTYFGGDSPDDDADDDTSEDEDDE